MQTQICRNVRSSAFGRVSLQCQAWGLHEQGLRVGMCARWMSCYYSPCLRRWTCRWWLRCWTTRHCFPPVSSKHNRHNQGMWASDSCEQQRDWCGCQPLVSDGVVPNIKCDHKSKRIRSFPGVRHWIYASMYWQNADKLSTLRNICGLLTFEALQEIINLSSSFQVFKSNETVASRYCDWLQSPRQIWNTRLCLTG